MMRVELSHGGAPRMSSPLMTSVGVLLMPSSLALAPLGLDGLADGRVVQPAQELVPVEADQLGHVREAIAGEGAVVHAGLVVEEDLVVVPELAVHGLGHAHGHGRVQRFAAEDDEVVVGEARPSRRRRARR